MVAPRSRFVSKLLERSKLWSTLYLLMLPTLLSMLVFGYYPKLDVIVKSFYDSEPGQREEFIGWKNFLDAAADPLFWQSFRLVAVLLVANIVKLVPGIITAIALHRLMSDRWRYIFQICFVIPMVIPALVWLLIWKSFYEPDFGLLNRFLNSTGLMSMLHWMDGTTNAPGVMPHIADMLQPLLRGPVSMIFVSVWGMALFGAMVVTLANSHERRDKRWPACMSLVIVTLLFTMTVEMGRAASMAGLVVCAVCTLAALCYMARALGAAWILWGFWLLAGVWACWDRLIWLPALVVAAVAVAEVAFHAMSRLLAQDVLRRGGWVIIVVGSMLVLLGMIWTSPTGQFEFGTPAWLGNKDLVIPALIFWGFPWVGTVGVLIYLAGLQQISQDIYEAAELDGVGPVRQLFAIELPLIMTQVRINLIFMTIGTLTGYEFFLILLGPTGGPGNKGMVPGLYMYQQAFIDGRFGYACALGLVLFVMILLLTIIYQRYVKVEK